MSEGGTEEAHKEEGESSSPKPSRDVKNGGQTDQKKDEEKSSKPFRPSRKALIIGGVVLLVLLVVAILYWLHARNFVTTDDAYTTGHVHEISVRVPGTVLEVLVDDNQRVKAGDLLVRLDPRDYEVALQKARAALAQAAAQKVRQEAAIVQAQTQVDQAAAQYQKAQQDYDRIAGLYTRDIKAVSKADVDAATANLTSAKSSLEGAQAALVSAKAELAVAASNITANEASVSDAELQLSYCNVVSPADGKVSKKTVESGMRVQPGGALMAIVPDAVWVLANLKETQLERLQIGERVDIKIDTLPHLVFFGTVNSIQEGSGATFSLLPPDNATGNFTKIVQRVPVKIVFDEESIRDFRDKIIPGLSVEPQIDLESLRDNKRERKRKEIEEKQNREAEKQR